MENKYNIIHDKDGDNDKYLNSVCCYLNFSLTPESYIDCVVMLFNLQI